MLRLSFSSKLEWGSYIVSTAKTAFKKLGASICSIKSLSPEVALNLYNTALHRILLPCLGWSSQVLIGYVRSITETDM